MAGFLDVLLRGLGLCGQTVAIGGILLGVLVLRPIPRQGPGIGATKTALLLVAGGAAAMILALAVALAIQLGALVNEDGWPVSAVFATTYFRASMVKSIVCMLVIGAALSLRRRAPSRAGWMSLAALGALLALAGAWTSHAAARLEHKEPLIALDAVHQFAAAAWVGGLFHLIVMAARGRDGEPWRVATLQRFSAMSVTAVTLLVVSGSGLSLYYVGGLGALIGTGYGLMVLTKVAILGVLSVLGAMNFFAVRTLKAGQAVSFLRVRRFVEVELGLGLTVLFAAASLTSLPPAIDVVKDRATPAEVGSRFTPRWPSLTSPPIEALPVGDREAPRTDEDRAWSEYNHHMAGLFVLIMGLLAILSRSGMGWARHWPLMFLGMAAFLLVRNDPGAWPLGPEGFWASMAHPEVLQHRLFVLLVIAFGLFEWLVRRGRLAAPRYALLFPLLCVVGGGLLLTHSHAGLNLKAEYLIEVTHAPLGVLALAVGWGRWLELRLPGGDDPLPGRVWTTALAAIGVLLLLYRES